MLMVVVFNCIQKGRLASVYAKKASNNGGSASSPTSFVRLAAEHAAKVSRAGKQGHSGGSVDEEHPFDGCYEGFDEGTYGLLLIQSTANTDHY